MDTTELKELGVVARVAVIATQRNATNLFCFGAPCSPGEGGALSATRTLRALFAHSLTRSDPFRPPMAVCHLCPDRRRSWAGAARWRCRRVARAQVESAAPRGGPCRRGGTTMLSLLPPPPPPAPSPLLQPHRAPSPLPPKSQPAAADCCYRSSSEPLCCSTRCRRCLSVLLPQLLLPTALPGKENTHAGYSRPSDDVDDDDDDDEWTAAVLKDVAASLAAASTPAPL